MISTGTQLFRLTGIATFMAVAIWIHPAKAQDSINTPLETLMAKRPKWDDDVSEVAYVGTRCAAVFFSVSGYLKANATQPSDTASGTDLFARTETIYFAASILSRLASMNEDTFKKRFNTLIDQYIQSINKNKRLLNNALHTPIEEDLSFCHRHEHNFKLVADYAKGARK
jgi:hypothetical protein